MDLSAQEAVPEIAAEDLLRGQPCIVDVRSPAEYREGSVPGAFNLPLLDDSERELVGRLYHEEGADEARMGAMRVTSPKLARYLGYVRILHERCGPVAVMCWRGGERSGNLVRLLALVGVPARRVRGGYRAYRRVILDRLQNWQPERPVVTLYGYTGSGKTAILRMMADWKSVLAEGLTLRPDVLDLEGLALHRGSLLGGLNQPGHRSQKQFDALLWHRLQEAEGDYVVLEGEGAKIGHIFLPSTVADAVRTGVPVLIEAGVKSRVARIIEEYHPASWGAQERGRFLESLERIGARMELAAVAEVREEFEAGNYESAVETLLVSYYDPLYHRSCVAGKHFAYTLHSQGDVLEDARRLMEDLPRVLNSIDRQAADNQR
ncbi:MAG: tRNA 2-selenouridine(34) synthase MnmH [Thermoleophilia bacterium]